MDTIKFIEKSIKVYGETISLIDLYNIVTDHTNYITVYTDGSSQYDGVKRSSGIGVFFGDNHTDNISRIVEIFNNNECEIIACIEALKVCKDKHRLVHVYTDSRLVVDGMNGVCSKAKYEYLFNELESLTDEFLIVRWHHVKGHGDNYGNIKADELSRKCFDQ